MDDEVRAALTRLDELCRRPEGAEPAFLACPPRQSDRHEGGGDDGGEDGGDGTLRRTRDGPSDGGLAYLSLHDVAGLVRAREVTCAEVVDTVLERIDRFDRDLRAFITVTSDGARERAAHADRELAAGDDRGPLHGLPVSLKDVIATAGVRTTCGSHRDEHVVPISDATAWSRLRECGSVLVGKNNMMEFAYAAELGNERWGVTRNPWDRARTAHGSSSGSAVAVATGMAYAALATETGASIQRPASFCGVVGFKASYGRVSRAGVAPTSWSMDHVGVMTRSVADAATALSVVVGPDPADPTTAGGTGVDWSRGLGSASRLRDLRIGVPARHIDGHVDDDVADAFWAAVAECRSAGAAVVTVDPPELEYAATTSVALRTAEAYSHHARALRERPDGYSEALRRQLEKGQALTAEDYLRAQRARRAIAGAMSTTFAEIDLMLSPTTPTAATLIDDGMAAVRDRPWEVGPHQYNAARVFSLVGLPVVSLPCGYTRSGMPISLQVGGRRWDEGTVLSAAHDYERRTRWLRHPPDYPERPRTS